MPGFMEALTGRPEVTKQFPRFGPEQIAAQQQLLQHVMPQLMGGQFDFGPIEEQARAGFKGRTLPSIAERLTGMGQGARYSSGAADIMGQAGTDLERSLAAMKQQFGMQRQGQLMGLLGAGLAPQFETQWRPETGGFLGGMAPGFGAGFGEQLGKAVPGMFGSVLGGWMGGPPGAAVGGAAGGEGASFLTRLLASLMSQKRAGA